MRKNFLKQFIFYIGISLFTLTMLGYAARWHLWGELAVSGRPLLLYSGLFFGWIALYAGHRTATQLILLSLLINSVEVVPYLWLPNSTHSSNLSILFYNADRNYLPISGVEPVIDLVAQSDADLVVLREIGVSQADIIKTGLNNIYQYHTKYQHAENDGVLILSRFPLKNITVTQLGGGRQVVLADLIMPENKTVHIVAPHPTNALWDIDERNRQLTAIADYVSISTKPVVIVGDLNVTMWSPWYKPIERAGVQNTRRGHGILPTWKIYLFQHNHPLLSIPLDHVLVSSSIKTDRIEALDSVGSDHRPLQVWLDF